MHPAFSVILFTTLSGAGYGLLFWLGALVVAGQAARAPALVLTVAGIALVLVSAGLLCSLGHLGRPERAWRAFSQWQSSWLSREGVAATLSFVPLIGLMLAAWFGWPRAWYAAIAIAAMAIAIVTVFCTSRIYDTLKPVPAWRTRWVLVNYLMLAAASGAAWLWAIGVLAFELPAHRGDVVLLMALLWLAALTKRLYWRRIDRRPPMVEAASALGLKTGSHVAPFEKPHTEANFLMKEMGFALARKHAHRLRRMALTLLAFVPSVPLTASIPLPELRPLAAAVSLLSVSAALLIERWLFFAEARHIVTIYYDAKAT